MALQFDIDVPRAEDSDELVDLPFRRFDAAMMQGSREGAFRSACKADEAGGVFLEFFCRDRALPFFRPQFHFCDQAAKVLIASAGRNEEGKAGRIASCRFQIAD